MSVFLFVSPVHLSNARYLLFSLHFAFGFKFHTSVLGVILLRTDGKRDCLFPCPILEFSQPHSLWVLRALTSVWDVCVGLVVLAALLQEV